MNKPRAVRNFWVDAKIDGYNTVFNGGPKGKDGGLQVTIYQRDNNEVVPVLTVVGTAAADGTLTLLVTGGENGEYIYRARSKR